MRASGRIGKTNVGPASWAGSGTVEVAAPAAAPVSDGARHRRLARRSVRPRPAAPVPAWRARTPRTKGSSSLDGFEVGVRADRRRRGDDTDRARPRGQRRCRGTRAAPPPAWAPHSGDAARGRATAVEVLQATTMALTSRRASSSRHSMLKRTHLLVRPRAVGGALVVAQVERVLGGQPPDDLTQDGQAADPGVEEADGSSVTHRRQLGDRPGRLRESAGASEVVR